MQISRIHSSSTTEILYKSISNSPFSPLPSPWQASFYFLLLWVWLFWISHISEIMQYLSFCDWPISLSIMSSRHIRVVAYCGISLFFKAEQYSIVCIYHIFFFKKIHLYWNIIASQYCVRFCCTTKWISHMHTYIPISRPSWASLPPSLSNPPKSSQSTKLMSLCYAAASH